MAAGALPFVSSPLGTLWQEHKHSRELPVHLFSKHLQFLDCREAAEVAAQLGFAGLDLTVRPGGHVAPEKVREQLPRAMEAIKGGGSHCRLITTAVANEADPMDMAVLETAAAEGVSFYRTNWFRYHESMDMKASLKIYRDQLTRLSRLNKKLGLVGCYQNHAGKLIGASAWELHYLLEDSDPGSFGIQYDIRHATVEGGLSWENGLRLLKGHIKSIVLKDFRWERVNGAYKVVNVPIGEGMVNFTRFFTLLKEYGIDVPAILHLEYPLGGAEHGDSSIDIDKELVFDAMKKDLRAVWELWDKS